MCNKSFNVTNKKKHGKMEVFKKMTIEYQNIQGNKKYKDSLFRMVFHRKEDL